MRIVWYSGEFQEGLDMDGNLATFPGAAREGYKFEGWYTEDGILVDGPDKVWQLAAGNPLYLMPDSVPGELEVPVPQTIDDEAPDLILYARWTEEGTQPRPELTGRIKRHTIWWRHLLHVLTFGIGWKDFQKVIIIPDASDVTTEYFVGEKCMTQEELAGVCWKPYSRPFRIHPRLFHRATVYARLTDGEGNTVIISEIRKGNGHKEDKGA
jgi:hypothetical protein